MKKRKKSDIVELQRIQSTIPDTIKKRIMRKQKVSPTVAWALREAIKSDEMSDKKKEQMQHVIDTGIVDQTEEVENKTAIRELNNYLEQEIAKSVVAGRLSKPKNEKVLAKYKRICRKLSRTNTSKK